jgi:glycosyltransferase involved in cell wall biosynthesis
MRIFTWHIHGSYLYFLSQGEYEIYIPVNEKRTEGYYGRGHTFPFGDNVIEVPAAEVKDMEFDCILFQTNTNYRVDQYEILSEAQRKLPRVYLEHDPPTHHPVNTRHIVQDPEVAVVHVTFFNRLMWQNDTPVSVIEHGVIDHPQVKYTGEYEKGLVIINNLPARGRLLGLDIFEQVRKDVPLDLVGMGTGDLGLGEVLHPQLPYFSSKYRFFFNPIRWTSLGLAICEAMMIGLPIIGLATTELSSVIRDGESGFIHTDPEYLVSKMKLLLRDRELAAALGENARRVAQSRFGIGRFVNDWKRLFESVISRQHSRHGMIGALSS